MLNTIIVECTCKVTSNQFVVIRFHLLTSYTVYTISKVKFAKYIKKTVVDTMHLLIVTITTLL